MGRGVKADWSEARLEAFCLEYVKDWCLTKAMERFNPELPTKAAAQAAWHLSQKPEFGPILTRVVEGRRARLEIEADDVLADIVVVKKRCMQGERVLDHEGNPTGEWKFDSRGALKALELVGKHAGLWKDELNVKGKIRVTVRRLAPKNEAK